MDLLPTGGYFAFSFNDHTLEDPAYENKVLEYTQSKRAQLVFCEYGAHLPGKDMKSNVYVLVKNDISNTVCAIPNWSIAFGTCLFRIACP